MDFGRLAPGFRVLHRVLSWLPVFYDVYKKVSNKDRRQEMVSRCEPQVLFVAPQD